MTDIEKLLLKRAKAGDIESFEVLVKKHQSFIYNVALRVFRNTDDASDMAQEALIKAYKNISNFNEKSSFNTWLYRITINVCIDEQRKRKNRIAIPLSANKDDDKNSFIENIKDNNYTPEESFLRKEEIHALNSAINRLPENHKIIILLRDIKGLGYDEIGDILNIPKGTVKSKINRARQKLKEIIIEKREPFNSNSVKIEEKGVR
jgi:RNA polymerase sigma-70 factor (ECF subfamily)